MGEYICINDASTDNSLEVLQKLKEKYLFADICIVEMIKTKVCHIQETGVWNWLRANTYGL